MNCPKCNTPVSDTACFCPNCGQALLETSRASRTIDLSPTEPTGESPLPPPIPPTPQMAEETTRQIAPIPQTAQTEGTTISAQSRILSSDGTRETKQIIKVVPSWKFDDETEHTVSGLSKNILKVSFYAAAGLIGLVAFILLTNGEFFGAILLCLFGYGFYYWVNPRWKDELEDYVPEKSFRTFRLTEKQLKPIFIAIAVGAAILYVLLFITADAFIEKRGIIGFFIAGGLFGGTMFGCYAAYKALAVHGNVDHETNEFLSEALGVDVDEIIQVSTQTFDDTEEELENGAKLLVMTNRRIYFASFQEDHWIKCNEYLKDISSIGLKHTMTDEGFGINSFNGAIQMRLMFNDNTSLHIDLDVSNKTTTTPSLFVKTFLETIDNHLLGRLPEKKNRRRRVTTTTEGQPSAQPTVSQSIIKGISNAEQVSGRKLDL